MNLKNISKTFILSVLVLLLVPATSFGYYTTAQQASAVTDNTALYTITYSFGLPTKDVYLPIGVIRGLAYNDGEDIFNVGYSLVSDSDKTITQGTSVGLALSSAKIVDNMYKIDAGTTETFTLAVIATIEDTPGSYALQVDKLPFIVETTEGDRELRELNNHELGAYKTESIRLAQ